MKNYANTVSVITDILRLINKLSTHIFLANITGSKYLSSLIISKKKIKTIALRISKSSYKIISVVSLESF